MLNDSSPAVHSPHMHWMPLTGRCEPLSLARDRIRTVLAGVVLSVDDAVLVVSELVGNAVRHTTAGPDHLTIEIDGDQVVVAVHDPEPDDGRVHLSETAADPLAESGRGLWLVQTLARRWYVETTAVGKAVVAVLPRGKAAISRAAGS
ncbi:Anti-sigma regulatory factor (Ser/Thr protein kinase) [Streptomyces sp. di188]|nr:Anti-sigma regulatory factor (Ser/Thr protein kinase) [Streptomyces sp. di188]SCD55177.1 Anti-sigma regulatory factor (Ser/Thr protein kinase) [Streptomyces sp. di50b]